MTDDEPYRPPPLAPANPGLPRYNPGRDGSGCFCPWSLFGQSVALGGPSDLVHPPVESLTLAMVERARNEVLGFPPGTVPHFDRAEVTVDRERGTISLKVPVTLPPRMMGGTVTVGLWRPDADET